MSIIFTELFLSILIIVSPNYKISFPLMDIWKIIRGHSPGKWFSREHQGDLMVFENALVGGYQFWANVQSLFVMWKTGHIVGS